MTCIVGIAKNGKVWLGGDSAATDSQGNQLLIGDPKVFVKDDIAFGVCGSPKVMDRLQNVTELPLWDDTTPEREFLVREVIPTIKTSLAAGECLEGDSMPGAFLIGFNGKLYQMQSNFQLITTKLGFDSVGSGGNIALGSLHSTKSSWSVRKRIVTALEAACASNAGCRPPFTIISV